MKNDMSIEKFIIDLENNMSLFAWKSNDIKIWELIRVFIYLDIVEKNTNDFFEKNGKVGFIKSKVILLRRFFCNSIFRNPFFMKRSDVLVLESGRKYLFDKDYIDIYTYFLKSKLIKEDFTYNYIETNYKYDLLGNNKNNKGHLDFLIFISKIQEPFIKIFLNENDVKIIKDIELRIFEKFNILINVESIVNDKLKKFYIQRFWFTKLIKSKKIRKIFLVNYVDYFGIIAAAKDNNVSVVELQHGLIIQESLIYHFPNVQKDSLNYFPDQFYVWKDFSLISGVLPITNIVENSYNHLEEMIMKYKNIEKENNLVLIASQPFYSDVILEYVLNNAKKMKNYNFVYKLHPMQFDSFFDSEFAKELLNLENVKIVKNEESIYYLLSKSRYVVGIYSTVLFESNMFGCKPLVLYSEYVSFSEILFQKKHAIKLDFNTLLTNYID